MKKIISTLLIALPMFLNAHQHTYEAHSFIPDEFITKIEYHDIHYIEGMPFVEFEGQYYDVADIFGE